MGARDDVIGFDAFVDRVESRLQQALGAAYGPKDGHEAAVDALSWAWEHWDQAATLEHPVAYLFRVGQSARRRFVGRPLPFSVPEDVQDRPDLSPELLPALRGLPEQQRVVVLLVHAYQWRQQEVADLLGVGPSTVQAHLVRGLAHLRRRLDVCDAH